MVPRTLVALLALAVRLAAPAGAQSVLVVDGALGPGATHSRIAAAVAAAASNDVVVVRSGTYNSFEIVGKSLSVLADRLARVTIDSPIGASIAVRDLSAHQRVVLRGLEVPHAGGIGLQTPGLVVTDCDGPVLVEDCLFRAENTGHSAGSAGEGVFVADSASTTFVRCVLEGLAANVPFPAGDGITVCRSGVQLFDCVSAGTHGATVQSGALFVSGGTLMGQGSAVRLGSNGAITPIPICSATAVVPDATLLGATLVSGVGTPDVKVELAAGTSAVLPGVSRTYAVTSPVREGETLVETYRGAPGDFVALILSGAVAPGAFFPEFSGYAYVQPPVLFLGRGLLDGTGTLSVSVVIPDLDPGVIGLELYEQAALVDAALVGVSLTNPAALLLLDGSL